jgi:hypothetical protein
LRHDGGVLLEGDGVVGLLYVLAVAVCERLAFALDAGLFDAAGVVHDAFLDRAAFE